MWCAMISFGVPKVVVAQSPNNLSKESGLLAEPCRLPFFDSILAADKIIYLRICIASLNETMHLLPGD